MRTLTGSVCNPRKAEAVSADLIFPDANVFTRAGTSSSGMIWACPSTHSPRRRIRTFGVAEILAPHPVPVPCCAMTHASSPS